MDLAQSPYEEAMTKEAAVAAAAVVGTRNFRRIFPLAER